MHAVCVYVRVNVLNVGTLSLLEAKQKDQNLFLILFHQGERLAQQPTAASYPISRKLAEVEEVSEVCAEGNLPVKLLGCAPSACFPAISV